MLNLNIKFIVGTLFDGRRRFHDMLVAMGAQRRCAQRLDAVGDRLLGMGTKINRLRAHISSGTVGQALDTDGNLRGSLKSLKEDIREIRCQLAALQTPLANARLARAFARLSKIAEDTYAAADKLQWEIDEYERDRGR